MGRKPKSITQADIDQMTLKEVRHYRNDRQSKINHLIALLDGKVQSIHRKSMLKMHESAKRYMQELELLDRAKLGGVPMRIYP